VPRFLGFETMSREDHIRAGLLGVVLLSLECVLVGLVTGAELRGWAIHAVAAGLGAWAMVGVEPLPVRATSATAIFAVVNEAVMYVDQDKPLKYIVPAFLLLFTSIWVLERSLSAPASGSASTFGEIQFSNDFVDNESISVSGFPPPLPMAKKNLWAPLLSAVGIGMTLYGFLIADWIKTRALFGLIRAELTYSDIRGVWEDFGAPSPIVEGYVGVTYVFGYIGVFLTLIGSVSALFRQFVVERPWRIAGVSVIGAASLMHLVVVFGLLASDANISVLSGAWSAPIGLGLAAFGFWASTNSYL